MISADDPDPGMAAALPPGAWWQRANTGAWKGEAEPYGPHAGDAAIQAALRGSLELRDVSFSYPMRPKMAGECPMIRRHGLTRFHPEALVGLQTFILIKAAKHCSLVSALLRPQYDGLAWHKGELRPACCMQSCMTEASAFC